jgi:hypothetical protein
METPESGDDPSPRSGSRRSATAEGLGQVICPRITTSLPARPRRRNASEEGAITASELIPAPIDGMRIQRDALPLIIDP